MKNLLEVRDLRVIFYLQGRSITAVDGINFHVKENEILFLAGESGSGKTITALALTKTLPKNAAIVSANIVFAGNNISEPGEAVLTKIRGKEISYIFQEPTSYLNPVFTIGSQISEAIQLHQNNTKKEAKEKAIELLRLVRIQEPERVFFGYPHQLSGGMNQRAFIAMALAARPRLLIADEPTTSLDVTTESGILHLLLDLKKEFQFSLLFITHNLSIAKRNADRIYIMYKGKIVEEGNREDIFNAPKHFHTKELIRAYERIGKL